MPEHRSEAAILADLDAAKDRRTEGVLRKELEAAVRDRGAQDGPKSRAEQTLREVREESEAAPAWVPEGEMVLVDRIVERFAAAAPTNKNMRQLWAAVRKGIRVRRILLERAGLPAAAPVEIGSWPADLNPVTGEPNPEPAPRVEGHVTPFETQAQAETRRAQEDALAGKGPRNDEDRRIAEALAAVGPGVQWQTASKSSEAALAVAAGPDPSAPRL